MHVLTMSILMVLLSVSDQQNQLSEENQPCGQYGFRCVDTKSFQICTYPDLDGQTEPPEMIRKCLDSNVCDEDNPAYCTPLDRIENEITVKPSGTCQKKVFGRSPSGNAFRKANGLRSGEINGYSEVKLRNIDESNPFGFDNEDIETTTISSESDDYPIFNNQKFECESFGYFPDIYNASMFWHCDHQNKGKGYIVRHMLCSSGRVFNPVHKECVMIGTTRNTRNNLARGFVTSYVTGDAIKQKQRPSYDTKPDVKLNYKFSCRNLMPGKYYDKYNCRLYHYCLPRSFAPFNELTFSCPDHLAYDAEKGTCNPISFERCIRRLHPHQHKIFFIEVDAIVLQKQKCKLDLRRHNPDCSEYHLCYNDQVVHLKCPDSYRFDENLLTCQPQHLVSCEY